MSDPTDIKALDEYLKGDSDVSRRYRELGRDEVPPELDRRVLAAARDAVANEGTRRSRSWLRWSTPVALAASVVLVVTVVLERGGQDQIVVLPQAPAELPEQSTEAPVSVQSLPQSAHEFAPPPAPFVEPAPAAPTVARDEAERFKQAPSVSEVVVTGSHPVGVPEAATPVTSVAQEQLAGVVQSAPEVDSSRELQEISVTGARRTRSIGRTAGPRNTISTNALRSERPPMDEQADHSDPQAWLEDIRDLRRAGKTDEADREWQRFRKAFPDFQVADDDIARQKP